MYFRLKIRAIGTQNQHPYKECVDCQYQIQDNFANVFHSLSFACVEQALFLFRRQAFITGFFQLFQNAVYFIRLCFLTGVIIVIFLATCIASIMYFHFWFAFPCRFLKQGSRQAVQVRQTAETEVRVALDLNGTGQGEVKTGIAFFDHMLEQIIRHGGMDLVVSVKGDLQVDEHHTIEDTAIVLGQCFSEALGEKKGIGRYGFALPMDEARAEVLLDLGGRSWLEWNAAFSREYVGDFPTEMTKHFFASFCQGAKCNLHVEAKGENTHHVIEAIFKAFARSLRMAVRQEAGGKIPSTKGKI